MQHQCIGITSHFRSGGRLTGCRSWMHVRNSHWHDGLQLTSLMNSSGCSIYIYGKQQVFSQNSNYFFEFHLVIGNSLLGIIAARVSGSGQKWSADKRGSIPFIRHTEFYPKRAPIESAAKILSNFDMDACQSVQPFYLLAGQFSYIQQRPV